MDVSKIKKELIEQKKSKFKGNIYHFSQVVLLIILIKLKEVS